MTTTPDWHALGEAVKVRRAQLRLRQDLSPHGGPGEMTMRKIERAEATAIRGQTKDQIERALRWPRGHVDRLLDGDASPDVDPVPDDRDPLIVRSDEVGTTDVVTTHNSLTLADVRALRVGRLVLELWRELSDR